MSDRQLIDLLSRLPEYGSLADPQRLADCLRGLGYSAAANSLGATQVDMGGRPGVLILLPGDAPESFAALVVEPDCSSADTGLLAYTVVARP